MQLKRIEDDPLSVRLMEEIKKEAKEIIELEEEEYQDEEPITLEEFIYGDIDEQL